MRISLKSHTVNGRQAAKIAFADAIIWLWFHQVAYTSIFSTSFMVEPVASAATTLLGTVVLGAAFAVGVVRARWDAIPIAIRIGVAICLSAVMLTIFMLPESVRSEAEWSTALLLALNVGSLLAAILRMETLAKCDNFATLSVALSGSCTLFYLLSLFLLSLPIEVYSIFMIAAPLILIVDVNHPVPLAQRCGPLPRRICFSMPSAIPCLVGALVGFVVALGTISMATAPNEVFTRPSPLFLIAQLLFILLSIITVFGLDLRKATYFAIANVFWGTGSMLGGILHNRFAVVDVGLLSDISSFLCLMTIVLFLAFSGVWMNNLGRTVLVSSEDSARKIAEEAGLTPREIEVTMLLLEGRSLRIVQEELYISEGTARTHAKRIYSKLGVHSKQELIDYFKERVGN